MAFLKVCLPSCFDGFERMNHAMKNQTPLAYSPRKTAHSSPLALTIPPIVTLRFDEMA